MSSASSDPFSLLGVPARFDLDKSELEARQRELSKVLHPDRFAAAGAVERRAALNKAMSVNEAVRSLKSPVSRGHALLGLLLGPGAEVPEVRVPPMLLMEVMEWREELSNAFTRRDKSGVERIASTASARRSETLTDLTNRFAALTQKAAVGGVAVADPDVAAIAQGLATLKYFERLAEEVRRMEDELGDA